LKSKLHRSGLRRGEKRGKVMDEAAKEKSERRKREREERERTLEGVTSDSGEES